MVILSFHEGTVKPLTIKKMTKSSYLPQMTFYPKNKGTLFSSTLKVEEKKVVLFFWFDVNLVRYSDFEFVPIWPFLGKNGQKNIFFIEFVVGLKQL